MSKAFTKCSASLTSKRIKIAWHRNEQPAKPSTTTLDVEAAPAVDVKPSDEFAEGMDADGSDAQPAHKSQPDEIDTRVEANIIQENIDVFEDFFSN